jgi:hypothetical protein
MTSPNGNNDTTPESSDSESLSATSEPMIIDGKVVDGPATAHVVEPEIVDADSDDYTPAPRPRNGMANAGMFLGIASLLINSYAITSLGAIVVSIIGIRRSIALFRETGDAVGRWPATIGLALGTATIVFAAYIFIAQPTVS